MTEGTIRAVVFEVDEHTVKMVNGRALIWVGGETCRPPDVSFDLRELQRMMTAANMLVH
jgi:hypothetical protein